MSLVTVSEKKNRVYHRHFDHEEAQRLRVEGWSYTRLAAHFSVSYPSVRRVCDPEFRAQFDARSLRWVRENMRAPCKGGCGRRVWLTGKDRTGYCQRCLAVLLTAGDVRPDELRCTRCREWKPDAEFTRSKRNFARRHRRPECRACETKRRREHRHRRPALEQAQQRRVTARRRKEGQMARYIVFRPNGEGFVEYKRIDAGSPAHAIEQAAEEAGEYVAVPEGRFKLMRVAPVQSLRVVEETSKA